MADIGGAHRYHDVKPDAAFRNANVPDRWTDLANALVKHRLAWHFDHDMVIGIGCARQSSEINRVLPMCDHFQVKHSLLSDTLVISGKFTEGSFTLHRIWPDDAFDHKFCVRRQQQIRRRAFDNWDRLALDTAEKFIFGNVFRESLRTDDHEQWIDAPSGGDFHRFSLLPGTRDMQARVFSRREIKSSFFLTLKHHAVRADVEIARVRVAGDNTVRGPGVMAAIQRPMLRYRQLG